MARRAALIANPAAGRGLFETLCDRLVLACEENDIDVVVRRTTSQPGSAQRLASEAAHFCDLVIACGGDGTVHEVLQGLVGTKASLGVLPFGTANALARNLLLSLDPVRALKQLLAYRAVEVPVGRIRNSAGIRWFILMAGAGPDGGFIYHMNKRNKAFIGRNAYYLEAVFHFFTHRFRSFEVEYRLTNSARWHRQSATAMMVARVPNLGGLFRGLTASSSLHHPYLKLQLIAAPAHLALAAWLSFGQLGLERYNPWLTKLEVEEIRCTVNDPKTIVYAQVDGETAGALPITIRIGSSSVWLLLPVKHFDAKGIMMKRSKPQHNA